MWGMWRPSVQYPAHKSVGACVASRMMEISKTGNPKQTQCAET